LSRGHLQKVQNVTNWAEEWELKPYLENANKQLDMLGGPQDLMIQSIWPGSINSMDSRIPLQSLMQSNPAWVVVAVRLQPSKTS